MATAADQRTLASLLTGFEGSQSGPVPGRASRTRSAVLAIAQAGSRFDSPIHARTSKDFLVALARAGGETDERPWWWVAAVVEAAERDDDMVLVARAALFTWHFTSMAERNTQGEYFDMRLWGAPDAVAARIYSIALRGLPRLDLRHDLVRDEGGDVMQVGHVLTGCAVKALKITRLLDPDVVAIARRVVDRPGPLALIS